MVKSALVVCPRSADLLDTIRQVGEEGGYQTTALQDWVCLLDAGGRQLIGFEAAGPESYDWTEVEALLGESVLNVWIHPVECRWEDMFCDVVRAVGALAPCVFVLDDSGKLTPALAVDPASIKL